MPTYEYRCENGHLFEVIQRMADEPITSCATCGAPVQRVFHPIAVHFKGSGFYNTDYGKKKGAGGTDQGPGKSEDGKSDSKGETKSDSKSSDSSSSDSKKSDSSSSSSSSSKDSTTKTGGD